MKIDDLLEKNLKDNLDTSLDLESITVSDELKEKTLKRINAIQSDNSNKVVELSKAQNKEDRKHGILPKLRVVSGLAAAAILLTISISAFKNMIPTSKSSESTSKDSNSMPEFMYEDSKTETMVTDAKNDSEMEFSAATDTGEEAISEEQATEDNFAFKGESPMGVQSTPASNENGNEAYTITGTESESEEINKDNIVPGEEVIYIDTFNDLCGIKAEDISKVLFRNIIKGEDILVEEKSAMNQIYQCMDQVRYNSMTTGIADPGEWYYVLEIEAAQKSFVIWIGSYMVVENQMVDEESSISYEPSDISRLVNALSSCYQDILDHQK